MTGNEPSKMPSNRSFGVLFGVVFTAVAAWLYLNGSPYASAAFLSLGCLMGAAACFYPFALTPFNKAWFLLGQILNKAVSPVVLGILFFAVITPISLICRLFGRDVLRLKRSKATTYWMDRTTPTPDADSFKNQF